MHSQFSAKQWECSETYTLVGNPIETGTLQWRCTLAHGHSKAESASCLLFPPERRVNCSQPETTKRG